MVAGAGVSGAGLWLLHRLRLVCFVLGRPACLRALASFPADGLVLSLALPALTSRIDDVCCCCHSAALRCAAVRRPLLSEVRLPVLNGASGRTTGPAGITLSTKGTRGTSHCGEPAGHLSHHLTCFLCILLDVSGSRASILTLSGGLEFLTSGRAPRGPGGICFTLVIPSPCLLHSFLSLPTEKEQPSRQLVAGAWS